MGWLVERALVGKLPRYEVPSALAVSAGAQAGRMGQRKGQYLPDVMAWSACGSQSSFRSMYHGGEGLWGVPQGKGVPWPNKFGGLSWKYPVHIIMLKALRSPG